MFTDFATAEEMISDMIFRGELSPAAAEMDPAEVIEQYNEVNALTPDDDDYLIDPELQRTTITTTSGEQVPGFSLRSNPSVQVENPSMALGADRISRDLGGILVGHR
ncbi:hypothetical protein [Corynebacterium sp.]|uniref:hypothetical protein n=1 Tax=Corynebacterium sp. TaxID=1720 RepID=UPI0028A80002|nr:hypothetical protein [Corynebacterium sp.]